MALKVRADASLYAKVEPDALFWVKGGIPQRSQKINLKRMVKLMRMCFEFLLQRNMD